MSSEIVFNMAAHRNVGKALCQFGIADSSTSILFVALEPSKDVLLAVRSAVDGDEVLDVSAGLASHADIAAIQKVYEIPANELTSGNLTDSITTRIAVRDVR